MTDKQIIEHAREQLPNAKTFADDYIQVTLTLANGKQQVVKFTKMISDGEIIWLDMPLNS